MPGVRPLIFVGSERLSGAELERGPRGSGGSRVRIDKILAVPKKRREGMTGVSSIPVPHNTVPRSTLSDLRRADPLAGALVG
jgi:hypothetical protein